MGHSPPTRSGRRPRPTDPPPTKRPKPPPGPPPVPSFLNVPQGFKEAVARPPKGGSGLMPKPKTVSCQGCGARVAKDQRCAYCGTT